MRARLRQESGFALMGAMLILIILMGIGIALVSMSDNQQNQSGGEKVKESSFNLAEAALDASALQLGRHWPTAATGSTVACTPSNWSTYNYCPEADTDGTHASFAEAYRSQNAPEYASACPGGSSTPLWQTQVNDDVAGEQYWTTAVSSRPSYDANANGTVWLRAWANVRCKVISIVALVSQTQLTLAIPNTVVSANWLTTSNQGKKVIIDTRGNGAAQPSKVVLRCNTGAPSNCANYSASKGQIAPNTVQTNSGSSPTTLTTAQLTTLEQQAAAASCPTNTGNGGTCLWTTGCPTTAAQLTGPVGAPVVVLGPCDISLTGNNTINSSASPGSLVIENGTFSLGGNSTYYGLLYMVNKQASSGSVVNIQGNANITGAVLIDGAGGLTAGSSKTNLVFDQRVTSILRGSTGSTVNRGSVRTLPPSTP